MSKNTDLPAQGRSQTIDAAKGAAILLVMAGHVLVWNHMEDPYIYDVIKVIQMPLFMLISGYLCGIGRRVTSLASYGRILKKRALSYLTPFFFWIVLQHPLEPVSNIIETLFELDKGLWFLMTLFLLTAMVYTAQLLGAAAGRWGKERLVFWLACLVMAAVVAVQTFLGAAFLSPGLTRLYLPFYLAGYLAGEQREKLAKIPKSGKALAGVPALLAVLALAAFRDLQDVSTLVLLGQQVGASFLGCCGVLWLLTLCQDGRGKRFLAWLGGYTLEIYVVHFHFATVLNQGKTYELYTWQGLVFAAASFLVMSAITAAIIAVTKCFPILDFLLYGKLPSGKRF